jgi:hypothetical protein
MAVVIGSVTETVDVVYQDGKVSRALSVSDVWITRRRVVVA